jgi:Protein of unknown function (DUF642)/PEP-CTERM motif
MNTEPRLIVFSASVLVAMLFGNVASAATIVNGGFETETTQGNILTYTPGEVIGSGWTVEGGLNTNVLVLSSSYTEPGVSFSPHSGTYALDITGAGNQGTFVGINQTVSLTQGTNYELTFWVGNVTGDGTPGSNSAVYTGASTIALLIDGTQVGLFTNSNVIVGNVDWEEFTYDFTATFSSELIEFQNATTADNYAGLDDVSIATVIAGVPEPSSWAMMILGFFGLSAITCRRRRNSAAFTA